MLFGAVLIFCTIVAIDVYQNKLEWDKVMQEDVVSTNTVSPIIPEPEHDPVPEGNYVDKNMYVYSFDEAEFLLDFKISTPYVPDTPDPDYVIGAPGTEPTPESEPTTPGMQVDVTGQQQVRRGTTHDIVVDVTRDGYAVSDALVRITIEDYGKNVIRDFKTRTDDSGKFVFSWEIPKSFDDIETLLAYVDVADGISAKTILFKFQVYCLPGETGCKVEVN